jgi:lysozyme
MPRLPDFRQVGEGNYRPSRAVVTGSDLNGGAVGRGIARAGQTLSRMSDEAYQKQSAMGLLEADIHKARHGTELERSFDSDPDYASYDMRWKTGVAPINEDAAKLIPDPELRKKWLLQQEAKDIGVNDRLATKAGGLAKAADLTKVNGLLEEGADAYIAENDDALRMQRLNENEARITFAERNGLLSPEQAAKARDTHVLQAKQRRLQMLLDSDPEAVIPKVVGTRRGKPLALNEQGVFVGEDGQPVKNLSPATKGPASDTGLAFIRQQEDFKERAYPDGRQYSVGFGTKARSPNEVITREEAEKRLLAESNKVAKWVDGNVTVPLTRDQKDALISFGYNLGTDDLDKLKADINAGNFERVAQRMQSFNRANLDGTGLKEHPGLTRRRQMEAQMFLGEVPDAEFADLPPDVRVKFAKEAASARDVRLQSRLWDLKQQIDDDVQSVRKTGVGRENIEIDAIKRAVEPSVWNKYVNDRREAEMEFEAGRDLDTMPTGDLKSHVDRLVPEPGSADYGLRAKVYDKVKKRADKIRELREKDPAAAVNDFPEVKRAAADYKVAQDEGGADIGKVVKARLDAQTRAGIPAYDQSPITRAEGKALLDLPSNTSTLPEKEYNARLRAAADRAEEQYGPLLGRQVFEAAVRFHLKDKTGSDYAAGLISKMVKGEAVTRDDYSRMTELQSIDQIGRTFDATLRPDMGDEDRPYISPLHAAGEKQFASDYAGQEAARTPNPAQEKWLHDNPDAWQAFDLKFGRGAAARVLGTNK